MATNKNQHFVPRCYLRPFTIDTVNKAINIFNLDRDIIIQRAAVKHQCSGNYFYGQDPQLEKAIQALEGRYAAVAKEVQEPGYKLIDEHRSVLKLFWLFQHLRTEAASRRAVEMTDAMTSVVAPNTTEFRLNIKEAVIMAMRVFAEEMTIVDDMKICLIRNKSDTPFVTSDDPAILTNRWHLQTRSVQGHSFGLNSAGSLYVLPISPTILMLAYDGDVYSVPHKNGWAAIRSSMDSDAFNQHQYLNCRANIFLHDGANFERIRNDFTRVVASRPKTRHKLNYAVKDESSAEFDRYVVVDPSTAKSHNEALIHTQTIHPTPNSWPLQLRWRRDAVVYTNGTGIGYIRNAFTVRSKGPPFEKKRVFVR